MTWSRTVEPTASSGLSRRLHDEASARAGEVFQVVRCRGVRLEALDEAVYQAVEDPEPEWVGRAGSRDPDRAAAPSGADTAAGETG